MGEQRHDAYAEIIATALQEIANFPGLGRVHGALSGNVRSFPVRQHLVYYETDDSTVTILRVLHEKMDAARHLGS
ncbi:MAG: type II toxin-antitoxin system RelE/ParE family toxin [Thermomicrobiales bacterium]